MSKTRNLYKRGNVFYARVAAPKALRELRKASGRQKQGEVHRSLGTSDLKEARRRLASFLDQCFKEFEREEAQLGADGVQPLRPPTAEDLAAIRHQFFKTTLQVDEWERTEWESPSQIEAMREQLRQQIASDPPQSIAELIRLPGYAECVAQSRAEISIDGREVLKRELTKHLAQNEFSMVRGVIDEYCPNIGLRIEPTSHEYRSLARGLIKEWIKALEITEQRDQGIYDPRYDIEAVEENVHAGGASAPAQVVDLSNEREKHSRKGKRIRDYFDAHLKECKPHLRENDLKAHWATLRQFVECNGDKPVTEYGRSDMSAFKKGLRKYPANAARFYPDVPFNRVLQRNQSDGHPTLSSHSVRTKLSIMSVFGKWLEENVDGVDANNFSTSLPKRDDRQRMEPFTLDEVRKILNSYAFTGCESERNYGKPGTFKLRDWHFWFTLIAAFTGARTNEIMQLELADLREERGVLVFDISDEGEGKSLKTKGSRRLVPVHPTLIELGLLDYRDKLEASGAKSLFEDAPVDKDGRRAKVASKWSRKFLGKIGVKGQDDLGGFHRWRHTLPDALRRADVDQYDIAAAMGHEIDISRMNRHYGREMDMSLEKRKEILSKAAYPGVDFSLLAP